MHVMWVCLCVNKLFYSIVIKLTRFHKYPSIISQIESLEPPDCDGLYRVNLMILFYKMWRCTKEPMGDKWLIHRGTYIIIYKPYLLGMDSVTVSIFFSEHTTLSLWGLNSG